jgi:hypothetical protein
MLAPGELTDDRPHIATDITGRLRAAPVPAADIPVSAHPYPEVSDHLGMRADGLR